MRVAFVYPSTRSAVFGVSQTHVPSMCLYGSVELRRRGVSVTDIEPSPSFTRQSWRMFRMERILERVTGVRVRASAYLPYVRELNQADVIFATSDQPGLAVGLLKALGLVRPPLVWIAMSVCDNHQRRAMAGKAVLRGLVRKAHVVTLAGKTPRQGLVERFGLRPEHVTFVHWGIDTEFYKVAAEPADREYLFATGEAYRDYPTLFSAAEGLGCRVRVVAPLSAFGGVRIPRNVEIIPGATLDDVCTMMAEASAVVVSTALSSFSAGQWTAMSAMSMGKPVIWTEPAPAAEYGMQHRVHLSMVPPGDAAELGTEILWHRNHAEESARIGQNAARLIRERFTMDAYAAELEAVLNTVVGASGPR